MSRGSVSLSEQEKLEFRKYGQLPKRKLPTHRLKERKYFDSGDYAMSKAGKQVANVGEDHPSPDTIPHHVSSPGSPAVAKSPESQDTDTTPVVSEIQQQQQQQQAPSLVVAPAPVPDAPATGRPQFVRRVSQAAGAQYRVKD
ncbi:hypothetical protein GGI25_005153 [Coemansia spiralis]|uniref:mRNA stability protein n=1 Tax=Coemansia spiralis TaxID=417178 RepID=A0A9W8KUY3_9FUNG|nr:hypothetical protein GGI25_005153 [Coemansia spiralis]